MNVLSEGDSLVWRELEGPGHPNRDCLGLSFSCLVLSSMATMPSKIRNRCIFHTPSQEGSKMIGQSLWALGRDLVTPLGIQSQHRYWVTWDISSVELRPEKEWALQQIQVGVWTALSLWLCTLVHLVIPFVTKWSDIRIYMDSWAVACGLGLKTERLENWGQKGQGLGPVWTCVLAKPLQSCPGLCDSMAHSPPGSSVHGILQARMLEWVAMPSSRGSFLPMEGTHISYVSCISRWVLYH